MPTPACLATAVIGAPGSATNTARADSRMRWSLRAASAWRPLIGPLRPALLRPALLRLALLRLALLRPAPGRPAPPPGRAFVSVMEIIVPEGWNKPFRSDILGTEDFVPVERALDRREHGRIGCRQRPRPEARTARMSRGPRAARGAGWRSAR